MRVCCWLEVTRWGLLISPWFTVMAGLRAGKEASAGTLGPARAPPAWPSPPQGQHLGSNTGLLPPPNPGEAHQLPVSPGDPSLAGEGFCQPGGQSAKRSWWGREGSSNGTFPRSPSSSRRMQQAWHPVKPARRWTHT